MLNKVKGFKKWLQEDAGKRPIKNWVLLTGIASAEVLGVILGFFAFH